MSTSSAARLLCTGSSASSRTSAMYFAIAPSASTRFLDAGKRVVE
ncbi:hypothetical protein ACFYXL_11990 [Streptomyces tsukubensis]